LNSIVLPGVDTGRDTELIREGYGESLGNNRWQVNGAPHRLLNGWIPRDQAGIDSGEVDNGTVRMFDLFRAHPIGSIGAFGFDWSAWFYEAASHIEIKLDVDRGIVLSLAASFGDRRLEGFDLSDVRD
jgi:hypothetical protein